MSGLELIARRSGWVLAATLGLLLLALAVVVDLRTGRLRLEVDPADDRLLADIGVSREAARAECRKPFWRA